MIQLQQIIYNARQLRGHVTHPDLIEKCEGIISNAKEAISLLEEDEKKRRLKPAAQKLFDQMATEKLWSYENEELEDMWIVALREAGQTDLALRLWGELIEFRNSDPNGANEHLKDLEEAQTGNCRLWHPKH